jgi:hypothetical protein
MGCLRCAWRAGEEHWQVSGSHTLIRDLGACVLLVFTYICPKFSSTSSDRSQESKKETFKHR